MPYDRSQGLPVGLFGAVLSAVLRIYHSAVEAIQYHTIRVPANPGRGVACCARQREPAGESRAVATMAVALVYTLIIGCFSPAWLHAL